MMIQKIKFMLLAAMVCLSGAVYAQNESYRMLVKKSNETKGYRVDRVEEVSFAKVEGEVKAEVSVSDVQLDRLTVTVKRSEACKSFRIAVAPRSIVANYWNYPDYMIQYIEQYGSSELSEDFENGSLTGIELESNSDYTAVTVGYDEYDVACDLCRADFTTPTEPLVGNPKVTTTVTDVQKYQFSVYCEPNDDVKGYACVAGEKGIIQSQYDMYAMWFGFTNFGDMIQQWGYNETSAKEQTWTDMNPGTDYEVFVQAWDVNGTYADCDTIAIRTESLGGTGEASVSITLGDYKLQTWGEEQLPSQFITFTPNDQASCYRYGVYLVDGEDGYNANKEALQEELKQDPPYENMAYWFFYEPLTTDFQINPSTSCVAIASAKNINGEWGPVTETFFTTPESANAKVNANAKIQSRKVNQKRPLRMNRVPVLRQNKIAIR